MSDSLVRPQALVTGASSGLGKAFADILAAKGYDLILVARRQERLETLATDLIEAHLVSVEAVTADLAIAQDLLKLEELLGTVCLELLVNNAGFGEMVPFVKMEADRAQALISLQVTAVTRMTRAALPIMINRGRGAIINVSSRLSMSAAMPSPPLPPRAVYAATKAYINTFTQLLDSELGGTGVRVQALCPGLVRTEFFERMGIEPASMPAATMMDPTAVVKASLAALDMGEVICVPALDDSSLLGDVNAGNQAVFEHSNSSEIAERYTS